MSEERSDEVTKAWQTFNYWRLGLIERSQAVEHAKSELNRLECDRSNVKNDADKAWAALQKLLGKADK